MPRTCDHWDGRIEGLMSRPKHRFQGQSLQLPITGRAALVRENIARRRQRLDEFDEIGALDAAALLIDRIYEIVVGNVPALSADRTPRYRRGELSGEHGFHVEDLMYVLLADQAAAFEALATMAEILGYEPPQPADPEVSSLGDEMADVIESFSETTATFTRAMCDGEMSRRDASKLRSLVDRLLREVVEFKAAVVGSDR